MVLYNGTTGEATFVNARETAPASATENMYSGDGYLSTIGNSFKTSAAPKLPKPPVCIFG